MFLGFDEMLENNCQAAQNALAGAQYTELVVIGIGHDHPIDLALADVDSSRPKGNEAVKFDSLINVAAPIDVQMEPVLPDLRGKRRTPGDERTGAVRRADRGFFILIPDQRPSKRLAPEASDLPRTVARDRSEPSAVSEEGVVRLDDAELVAFGVGEHDMIVVWALTDVDVAGAELDQPLDRFLLVIDGRARQIEIDAILPRLPLRNRRELDPESGVVRRHETDLIMGLVVDLPVQSVGPEARESGRIVRIEAESDEPRSHLALHHTCRLLPGNRARSRSSGDRAGTKKARHPCGSSTSKDSRPPPGAVTFHGLRHSVASIAATVRARPFTRSALAWATDPSSPRTGTRTCSRLGTRPSLKGSTQCPRRPERLPTPSTVRDPRGTQRPRRWSRFAARASETKMPLRGMTLGKRERSGRKPRREAATGS